jgi:hypothetical protein
MRPLALVAPLIAASLTVSAHSAVAPEPTDSDTYRVYAVALREFTALRPFVLLQRETRARSLDDWDSAWAVPYPAWATALADHRDQNASPRRLQQRSELGGFRLMPSTDVPDPEGWETFWRKHDPERCYGFVSAVGFDATHERAIVSIGRFCGFDNGDGYSLLLERWGDEWHVVDDGIVCIWIT